MKIIRIQPRQRPDGTLPYPFFIDENGRVGRQDFWKGNPIKLIGFDISPEDQGKSKKTVSLKEFLADPIKCLRMYPIFTNTKDQWSTWRDSIESYQISNEAAEAPKEVVTKKGTKPKAKKKSK